LSEEDLSYYDIPLTEVDIIKGNAEFIYQLSDVLDMKGKKWQNFRTTLNKISGRVFRLVDGSSFRR